ncbi:hypothetical protein NECAME_04269 [Necator americanus]|uniref:polynucleotide adenylyltransferase n=1 Tax=Necator americanus TaxID=51031 RepID=W2SVL8_NECAM|nr:hypothetical protein NECAME_04269 [Necator americanus]ETN73583.1 hypothetical protein NECAME_04269 [Necator americanus]
MWMVRDASNEPATHILSIHSCYKVDRLRTVLSETVEIHGKGNFPTISARLIDIISCVREKLRWNVWESNALAIFDEKLFGCVCCAYMCDDVLMRNAERISICTMLAYFNASYLYSCSIYPFELNKRKLFTSSRNKYLGTSAPGSGKDISPFRRDDRCDKAYDDKKCIYVRLLFAGDKNRTSAMIVYGEK